MFPRYRTVPVTSDDSIVEELVAVLAPHPGGLRRWSVMNAIRKNRRAAAREIPQKMEAEIERIFRHHCSGGAARFRRPTETAGEVWALNDAWAPAEAAE